VNGIGTMSRATRKDIFLKDGRRAAYRLKDAKNGEGHSRSPNLALRRGKRERNIESGSATGGDGVASRQGPRRRGKTQGGVFKKNGPESEQPRVESTRKAATTEKGGRKRNKVIPKDASGDVRK